MVVRITQSIAQEVCDLINGKIDAGSGNGLLRIYSGTRPANNETAVGPGNTVLVEFTLNGPAFGAAVGTVAGGTATANAVSAVVAAETGTATFFRVFDSDGNRVFSGDVSDTTGNGDLKLSSTSIVQGIDVTVVSLTTTMPSGV
jgi:hypothetical protein